MATLKQRLHRKNSSGSYDTIHLETSSSLVLRPSGRTVEQDLEAYLPKVQNSDTVPESLTAGQLVTGTTKAWLGRFGEVGHPYTHPTAKQCNYSVDTSDFAMRSELTELLDIGDIILSISDKDISDTYHLCNGDAINSSEYPELAAKIGVSANQITTQDSNWSTTIYNNLTVVASLPDNIDIAAYSYSSDSAVSFVPLYSTDGGINWSTFGFSVKSQGAWYHTYQGFVYFNGYVYTATTGGWTNHLEMKILRINPGFSSYTTILDITNQYSPTNMVVVRDRYLCISLSNYTLGDTSKCCYVVISADSPTSQTIVKCNTPNYPFVYFYYDTNKQKYARIRNNGTIEFLSDITSTTYDESVKMPITTGLEIVVVNNVIYTYTNNKVYMITGYTTATDIFTPTTTNNVNLITIDNDVYCIYAIDSSYHAIYKITNGIITCIATNLRGGLSYSIYNQRSGSAAIPLKSVSSPTYETLGCTYPSIYHNNAKYYIKQK